MKRDKAVADRYRTSLGQEQVGWQGGLWDIAK